MKTFDDIVVRIGAMDSLANSIEKAIDNTIFEAGMLPGLEHVQNLFYILIEQIGSAKEDIDEIAGHIEVCNAVYVVNRVEELKAAIERLKGAKQ